MWLELLEMTIKIDLLRVVETAKKKIFFIDVSTVNFTL